MHLSTYLLSYPPLNNAVPLPQVYKECFDSPLLSAIHLTLVESEVQCDTFMPPIDNAHFRLWSASEPRRDGETRYSFLCYTRAGGQEGPPALPPAVTSRHEELQVSVCWGRRWLGVVTLPSVPSLPVPLTLTLTHPTTSQHLEMTELNPHQLNPP